MITKFSLFIVRCLIAIGVFSIFCLKSEASTIKQIFVFGDSLSDNGNLFNINQGTFPQEPFFDQGHFSNGIAFGEHLALELGVGTLEQATALPTDFDLSSTNGIVFSIGGATTGNDNVSPVFPGSPPRTGLQTEITQFLTLLNRNDADPSNDLSVNPDALFTLWTGGNDYFLNVLPSPPFVNVTTTPEQVVGNLSAAITTFIEAGASQVLVGNLPTSKNIPVVSDLVNELGNPNIPNILKDLVTRHNDLLEQELQELRQLFPETRIVLFDADTLYTNIQNDPNAFGFITFDQGCTKTNLLSIFPALDPLNLFNPGCSFDPADQDKFFFWDNQHPTTAAHELLAENAVMTLQDAHNTVPEPGTLPTFGLLGLGLLLGRKITRKSH